MEFFIVNNIAGVHTLKVPAMWLLLNNGTFNIPKEYKARILCFCAARPSDFYFSSIMIWAFVLIELRWMSNVLHQWIYLTFEDHIHRLYIVLDLLLLAAGLFLVGLFLNCLWYYHVQWTCAPAATCTPACSLTDFYCTKSVFIRLGQYQIFILQ